MELLIIIAILLVIIAAAKVLKAKELVDDLKDPDSDPISTAEVKTNAIGAVVYGVIFFALVIAQVCAWNKYLLPSSASFEGVETDTLMSVTLYLIFAVFFITQGLLFWFMYKYHYKKGKKAFWFPHNNSIEIAWTVVPAIVLIMLVTYGMNTWDGVMNAETEEDALQIEFVSEQFKWTTRYAGYDNTLGETSFTLFGKNALGIATSKAMATRLAECENKVVSLEDQAVELERSIEDGWNLGEKLCEVETSLKNYKANIRRITRLQDLYYENSELFDAGENDIVIMGNEIKLPKGRQVVMNLRSKDVIHSAYLPHFRAQMNTVPGMRTQFKFTPMYTTEEYRAQAKSEGKDFKDFILLCNKICGASHYNMKIFIEVVEPAEYDKWIAEQKTFE